MAGQEAISDAVAFELEQYRALRAEIQQSMADGNQILAFGLAGLGVLLTAGIGTEDDAVRSLLFVLLVPLSSLIICSLWFAAQERTARASYFLSGIEKRVCERLQGDVPITWERWLRGPDPTGRSAHFWYTEQSAIALFFTIALVTLGYGTVDNFDDRQALVIVCASVTLVIGCAMARSLVNRFARWKKRLSSEFDPAAG